MIERILDHRGSRIGRLSPIPCVGVGVSEVGEEWVNAPAGSLGVGFRCGVGEVGGGGLCVGLSKS